MEWQVRANFPEKQPENEVLANVWARQKIEDLMQQSYYQGSPAVEEEVTQMALDYRLMSPYTSFVAVDTEQPPSEPSAPPVRMPVPIPLPEGAVWEGFFGELLPQADRDEAVHFLAHSSRYGRSASPSEASGWS